MINCQQEARIVSCADDLLDLQKESYLSLSMCSQLSLPSIPAISLKPLNDINNLTERMFWGFFALTLIRSERKGYHGCRISYVSPFQVLFSFTFTQCTTKFCPKIYLKILEFLAIDIKLTMLTFTRSIKLPVTSSVTQSGDRWFYWF